MTTATRRQGATAGALVTLAVLLLSPAPALGQGDGPHNLPLAPKGMNILVPGFLFLSGNFNPSQTVLIPGANVDVFAVPVTYIHTFGLGGRFARLFVTTPFASLDASGEVNLPTGTTAVVERSRTGIMDPTVTMHVGLAGAPALTLPEFAKRPKAFQLVGIVGTSIPLGTYDSQRLINLGTNRWAFRLGAGMVLPFGEKKRTAWESANSVMLFTTNTDLRLADERSQDPLFISENHFTHNFTPKLWSSADLRWQVGGETTTDGTPDDNLTNILGGGVSVGYSFTSHFGGYVSYGQVLATKGDAEESLFRLVGTWSF
jgi:hypothetical protein